MGAIASIFQEPRGARATSGDHDLFAHTDRIAGKSERFFFGHGEATIVRHSFRNGGPAVRIECRGQLEQISTAERTKAGVQVIKAAVDQFERNNFSLKNLA